MMMLASYLPPPSFTVHFAGVFCARIGLICLCQMKQLVCGIVFIVLLGMGGNQ